MIWVDNNIQTSGVSVLELFCSNAGKANLLPDNWNSCNLCRVKCLLELLKLDEDDSELLMVSSLLVKQLSSVVVLFFHASVGGILDVGLIWFIDEVFNISEVFVAAFGITVNKLRINNFLFKLSGSGHVQELNEFFVALLVFANINDHHEF